MSENRQRQKLLGVRVSRDELTILSLAAKREGKTLGEFLRDAGLGRADMTHCTMGDPCHHDYCLACYPERALRAQQMED